MKTKSFAVIAILLFAFAATPINAGGSGTEAFEKLKSLVGRWEQQSAGGIKSTLDITLTSGGTTLL